MNVSRASFANINPVSVANSIRLLPRPKDPAWFSIAVASQRNDILSALNGGNCEKGVSFDQMGRIGVHTISAPTSDPEADFSKLALIFAETNRDLAPFLLDRLDRSQRIGPVPKSVMWSFSIDSRSPYLDMWGSILQHDINNLMAIVSGRVSLEIKTENTAAERFLDRIGICTERMKLALSGMSTIGVFISAMERLPSDMREVLDQIRPFLSEAALQAVDSNIRELTKLCSLYRQYTPEEMMIRDLEAKRINSSPDIIAEDFKKPAQFMFANRENPGELFRSVIRRAGIRRAMHGGPPLDRNWADFFSVIKPMPGGRQLLADTCRELEGTDNGMKGIIESALESHN